MQNTTIEIIKELKPELEKRFGIKKLALFGSYARGDNTQDSDIDIAIIEMDQKNGFIIAKANRYISEVFDKKVDIGLLESIRPFIRKRIEKELIYV